MEQQEQGYEAKFVHPLLKRHKCPICLFAMRNPVQTECGHLFCRKCLEPVLQRLHPVCPLDREDISRDGIFPDNACRREILNLEVNCNFSTGGCMWIGHLKELEGHVDTCQYREIQCKQCGQYIQSRILQIHQDKECPMRPIPCPHCRKDIPHQQMEDHIKKKCPDVLHACPNDCDPALKMKLPELEEHLGSCPLTKIKCPYYIFGCEFVSLREDFPAHSEKYQSYHFQIEAEFFQQKHQIHAESFKKLEQGYESILPLLRQMFERVANLEFRTSAVEHIQDIMYHETPSSGNVAGNVAVGGGPSSIISPISLAGIGIVTSPGPSGTSSSLEGDPLSIVPQQAKSMTSRQGAELQEEQPQSATTMPISNTGSLGGSGLATDKNSASLQHLLERTSSLESRTSAVERLQDALEQRVELIDKRREHAMDRYDTKIENIEEQSGRLVMNVADLTRKVDDIQLENVANRTMSSGYGTASGGGSTSAVFPIGPGGKRVGILNTASSGTTALAPHGGTLTPISNTGNGLDITPQRIESLTSRLVELEHSVDRSLSSCLDQELRIQLLERPTYNGVLLWKVDEFERRRKEAIEGVTLSLYSTPFYTSRHGYKMCARIYLNGDGQGKNTHMSFFFVIMRGPIDELLPWPFKQKVTLTLVNQMGKRHVTDSFRPDPHSSSFQRPGSSEMNIASGCPMFIRQEHLINGGFVKDDCIYIRVVVDTSDLPDLPM